MSLSFTDRTSDESTYFLRTPHLGFRTWIEADLDLALGLWGDAEVTHLIGGPFSVERVQRRLAQEIANQTAYGLQYWPVFLLAQDAHVGCCGLRPYPSEPRVYELGFHLRKTYWGQGLAVEAARAVIAHAFERLDAAGLFAGHHPANESSRRVLIKLGFRYTHDEFYPPTGLKHPSYRMSLEAYSASCSKSANDLPS
jgi:[ribosomal protein S5]-alanine N-acetyltransferase